MAIAIRRATDADAEAIADLYSRARAAAQPYIPSMVHSEEEVRAWITRIVIPKLEAWVAEDEAGTLAGLLVIDEDWVDQLYVEPTLTGRGIGTVLLAHAQMERPNGLRLKTFATNVGAQRFYKRNGFTEAGRSEDDNEEGAPDILYVWRGFSN